MQDFEGRIGFPDSKTALGFIKAFTNSFNCTVLFGPNFKFARNSTQNVSIVLVEMWQ